MIKEPGFYEGVKFGDYRDWSNISCSELKLLSRCETLRKFKFKKDNLERKDTASLHAGRIFDSYASHLSDGRAFPFEESFIELPENAEKPNWNKKPENYTSGEKLFKAIEVESKRTGREIVSKEEIAVVREMVRSIEDGWFKESFHKILSGICQPSIAWFEKDYKLSMKGRPDFFLKDDGLIVDFKTTSESLDEFSFGETVFKYQYQLQAAVYTRGLNLLGYKPKGFCFFVIQTERPYEHRIFNTPEAALQMGLKKYQELMAKLSYAIHAEEWPSFSEVSDFRIPKRFLNGEN